MVVVTASCAGAIVELPAQPGGIPLPALRLASSLRAHPAQQTPANPTRKPLSRLDSHASAREGKSDNYNRYQSYSERRSELRS